MGDGEVQRLDAVQIALVHLMLAADLVGFGLAQELAQRRHRPFQKIDAAHLDILAARHQVSRRPWLARVKNTIPGMMAI